MSVHAHEPSYDSLWPHHSVPQPYVSLMHLVSFFLNDRLPFPKCKNSIFIAEILENTGHCIKGGGVPIVLPLSVHTSNSDVFFLVILLIGLKILVGL